jgi:hypothetical protein
VINWRGHSQKVILVPDADGWCAPVARAASGRVPCSAWLVELMPKNPWQPYGAVWESMSMLGARQSKRSALRPLSRLTPPGPSYMVAVGRRRLILSGTSRTVIAVSVERVFLRTRLR